MKRRHRLTIGKRLFFAALSLVLVVSAVEGLLRLFAPPPLAPAVRAEPAALPNDVHQPPFPPLSRQNYQACRETIDVRPPQVKLAMNRDLIDQSLRRLPVPNGPADERRIFIVGDSAAWGDSIEYPQTFAGRLTEALGNKPGVVVYNAAVNGMNSEMTAMIAARILECYQPAVLIVMAGNNEWFNYRFAPLPTLEERWHRAALRHSRLYGLLVAGARRFLPAETKLGVRPYRRLPFRCGENCELDRELPEPAGYEPRQWAADRENRLSFFRHNLEQIVRYAKMTNTPVLLLTLPYRAELCPAYFHPQPLISDIKNRSMRRQVHRLFETGRAALAEAEYRRAWDRFEQVSLATPESPLPYYYAALAARELGEKDQAFELFGQAREKTKGNLGAVLSINETIRAVADAEGADLLDTAALFAAAGEHPLDADNLLHDFCHPNEEGHRLIAEALLKKLNPRLK